MKNIVKSQDETILCECKCFTINESLINGKVCGYVVDGLINAETTLELGFYSEKSNAIEVLKSLASHMERESVNKHVLSVFEFPQDDDEQINYYKRLSV